MMASALMLVLSLAVTPPAAAPPAAAPEPPVGQPGLRIVAGQVPIVAGNAASARERAFDEALRQAVDQSLGEIVDPQTRAARAQNVKALIARGRTFIRRYRTLEEGEVNGAYAVKIEVEVDEAALRRATERWSQPAGGGGGASAGRAGTPELTLVLSGTPELGPVLVKALDAAGVRATVAAQAPAGQAAGEATSRPVALVDARLTDEGPVRGTAKVAVSCRAELRLRGARESFTTAPRAFAERDEAARADCLARAASELVPRLLPPPASAGGSDLRTLTVEADVVEPAAVGALLKTIRSVGAVTSAELRRVSPGRAEVRVRTRTVAAALAPALSRDASGMITLSNLEVQGDIIRVRVRLPVAPTAP
jgi:hypothetical protein